MVLTINIPFIKLMLQNIFKTIIEINTFFNIYNSDFITSGTLTSLNSVNGKLLQNA
jgi:hypothetical protein